MTQHYLLVHCIRSRFVVLVAGFAFLANLMYGGTVANFHTVVSSFSTLLRFPLGDFSYDTLKTVCMRYPRHTHVSVLTQPC